MRPCLKTMSIGLFVFTLITMLTLPQSLWADENQGRFSLGVDLGAMIPSEDELESSLTAGLSVGYGILPSLDAQFRYSYSQIRDVEAKPDGNLEQVAVNGMELGLLYKIMPQNSIVPYVGGGVGYYVTNIDGDMGDLRNNAQDRFEQMIGEDADVDEDDILVTVTKDNAFGGFLLFGVEFFFLDNISMQIEGRYTWFDPSLTVRVEYAPLEYTNENVSGLKGDNAQALVRFKIYF